MEEEIIVIEPADEEELVVVENDVELIPPLTQEKTVTATKEEQIVIPDDDYTGLSKVVVEGVTSEIDENIIPENIKEGITILGVQGQLNGGYSLQVQDTTLEFTNGAVVSGEELNLNE